MLGLEPTTRDTNTTPALQRQMNSGADRATSGSFVGDDSESGMVPHATTAQNTKRFFSLAGKHAESFRQQTIVDSSFARSASAPGETQLVAGAVGESGTLCDPCDAAYPCSSSLLSSQRAEGKPLCQEALASTKRNEGGNGSNESRPGSAPVILGIEQSPLQQQHCHRIASNKTSMEGDHMGRERRQRQTAASESEPTNRSRTEASTTNKERKLFQLRERMRLDNRRSNPAK